MFQKGHVTVRLSTEQKAAKLVKTLDRQVKKHGKYLEAAQQSPKNRGRDLYVLYITKNACLSPMQAIHAQCAHCMGWYVDGRQDCENPDCPLYPYMPYGQYRKVRVQGKEASNG